MKDNINIFSEKENSYCFMSFYAQKLYKDNLSMD